MFGVDDAEVPKKKDVAPFFRLKKIHFSAQLLEMGGGWPADGNYGDVGQREQRLQNDAKICPIDRERLGDSTF
jgi:hypothetical protein